MVANTLVKKNIEDLFIDKLPSATRRAFLYCAESLRFLSRNWYLAGGTALALQVGHRQSVDLDFFINKKTFGQVSLERRLIGTERWKTSFLEEGTIYGTLMDAKASSIAYPFFKPSEQMIQCKNVRILTKELSSYTLITTGRTIGRRSVLKNI